MTKKFVSRALMMTGLIIASATVGFAQNVPAEARVRRVAPGHEAQQPVAASSVMMSTSATTLNLTADQRAKISAMNSEVAALQAERAKLWQEYRAITTAPNYNDDIAGAEAAPRMHRIVEINNQLAPIVARQERELNTVLNASQRDAVARMVTTAKAGL
jgi:hypothetical protein